MDLAEMPTTGIPVQNAVVWMSVDAASGLHKLHFSYKLTVETGNPRKTRLAMHVNCCAGRPHCYVPRPQGSLTWVDSGHFSEIKPSIVFPFSVL